MTERLDSQDDAAPDDPAVAPAGAGYRVLARKYRPRRFADLIGQDALVRTLTNALASGRLAHAFLLTGVRGVGKTTTARLIARALNCTGADGTRAAPAPEPCNECENCRAIIADRQVDVIEMDAASRTGIDDIRELIDGVPYLPTMGRFKVYIIDEVHMLSVQASNALLKTLEEPPPHVKFVFATTEVRKIPITVVSRCQRFDLRRVDSDLLGAHLARVAEAERAEASPAALALIARAADGSVRDGLSLLDRAISHADGAPVSEALVHDMLGLADRARIFDLFEAVMGGEIADALDQLAAQYRAGADPLVVIQDLLAVCHWLTRVKLDPAAAADLGVAEAERVRGRALAEKLEMPELARAWQILLKGLGEAEIAPAPLAAVEMLLVRLAHAAALPSPAELLRRLDRSAPAAPAPAAATVQGAPAGDRGAGGGARAALAAAEPAAEAAAEVETGPDPQPTGFAEAVTLFARHGEMILYAHLQDHVHPVRFEPGRIEIRVTDKAPPHLASDLGKCLSRWTGRRWVVAVSDRAGAPSLAEQAAARQAAAKAEAAEHPLVRAIMARFADAEITEVRPRAGPATGAAPSEDTA